MCLNAIHLLETTDSCDFVTRVDNGWGFSLSSHEDNVDEIWRRRHRTHLLKVVDRHGQSCFLLSVDKPSFCCSIFVAMYSGVSENRLFYLNKNEIKVRKFVCNRADV